MLDTTLSSSFVPGINRKGDVAGANWMFLRPSIPAEHLVCLGIPAASTLATLGRFSGKVTIVASPRRVQAHEAASRHTAPLNVRWCGVGRGDRLPLPDAGIDILVIADLSGQWRLRSDRVLRREVRRILRPDATVYSEHLGLLNLLRGTRLLAAEARVKAQRFRLTPMNGELHTAIPAGDRAMASYFRQQALNSEPRTIARLRKLSRVARVHAARFLPVAPAVPQLVAPQPVSESANAGEVGFRSVFWSRVDRVVGRRGVLVGPATARLGSQPPGYLQSIAAASGVRLDQFRWALAAKGEYSSRKLLFYLTDGSDPEDAPPTYIVKMVRDPKFNARLENEYQALSLLRELRLGDAETLPRAVFFGHHAGLAIIGETVVDGVPFLERSSLTVGCPYFHGAIEWFTALATAMPEPHAAESAETADVLGRLFARFEELYRPDPDEHRFLRSQIAALSGVSELPLVIQHGDPGVWNMLATPNGRVALLDWEAAETDGMPLWDLYYFLRTYAVGVARSRGIRESLAGFTEQLVKRTPLSEAVGAAVSCYATRIGLAPELLEPLFHTCWMHRALKEATRLNPSDLSRGRYVRLLRLGIAQRDSLQHLFGR